MSSSDILERFLEDHARLRGKSEVLEALALRVLRGDEDLGLALRLKGEEVQEHLARHMAWEEVTLLPALKGVSGGPEVATKLLSEHAAQRAHLADCLEALGNAEPRPAELAKTILALLERLQRDMLAEEQEVLATLKKVADAKPGAC